MTFTKKALMTALAAGMLASPAATLSAVAQQQTQPQAVPAPTPAPDAAAPVDEAKLRSFAVAYLEVNKVAQNYRPQYEAAKDAKEQQRIQAEATKGMAEAVEAAEGITVEEYNQIVNTAQTNPEVAQQINTYLREAAEAAPSGAAPSGAAPAEPAPQQ